MDRTTFGSTFIQSRSIRVSGILLIGLAGIFLLWLASGLFIPAVLSTTSAQIQAVVTIFLGIFIEALPFLLAGVLASSAIHLWVTPAQLARFTPRQPLLAAMVGACLGLFFPVCECGSIPTARRLVQKGAPAPLGIAFMLAAPVINPIVIVSTWVAFGNRPDILFGRIVLTLIVATITALALGVSANPQALFADHHDMHEHDHHHEHAHDHDHDHGTGESTIRKLLGHASSEFFEMGRYLVIGGLIAACLQTFIPRTLLLSFGQGPVVSTLTLMSLAVILSICSTVDAFVALSFAQSFAPGAILAFLVFGPMVDIKSVLMYRSAFRRQTVFWMVLIPAQVVLLCAVIINLYII